MTQLGQSAAQSDTGRKRRRNEDSYVCEPPLFAVADGMGGAQAGEIASRLAAGALRENSAEGTPEERLAALIQAANARVYEQAGEDQAQRGMGTTITAALVVDGRVVIGHVGDSRAYRIRAGELEQLTEDHSLVAELVRSGKLSPEEAENHPQRSVITRALGTDPDVDVDVFSIGTEPGDLFMLCSDGLTGMVDDATILDVVEHQRESLDAAAKALIAAANRGGGEDNITVVLFEIASAPTEDTITMPALDDTAVSPPLLDHHAEDEWESSETAAPRETVPVEAPRKRSRGRALAWMLLGLALLGICAAILWGVARAHFIGAQRNGEVAIYQGVPWDLGAGLRLYRQVYRSDIAASELTQAERKRLFDHDLMSYASARKRIQALELGVR